MVEQWWRRSVEDVCRLLETDANHGLSQNEAARRLSTFGPNQLPEQKKISPWKIILNQFSSFIVWLLLAAALVAGFLGDWIDAAAISAIVILNASLGFFQEYRAEMSLALLRRMASPISKVVREGKLQSLPSREIVPGDLVVLEAGDIFPADGRVVRSLELAVDEASLTGESLPVYKITSSLDNPELGIGDRENMGFLGTIALNGKGQMIATGTGLQTEMGQIAAFLEQAKEEPTALQKRLDSLGHKLVWLCVGIVSLVFAIQFFRGQPLIENLLVAISLAVAAVPEGLPAIVTIALSIGLKKMAAQKALVRRLPSVETLGCTSVICTDKTGTLTMNEMSVKALWVNRTLIDVTGSGYAPIGDFEVSQSRINPQDHPELIHALKIGVLCNGGALHQLQDGWKVVGDPTEGALITVAGKAGMSKEVLEKEYPLLTEFPFDSERKRMGMIRSTSKGPMLFIKGAPDILLERSESIFMNGKVIPLDEGFRQAFQKAQDDLADQALRVIAVGYRPLPPNISFDHSVENQLIFVGLVAMRDPPRPEAKEAIALCQQAGISIVMVTGDHKKTAVAVARELNLLKSTSQVVSGAELDRMDDAILKERVRDIAIYARTSASHKMRIIHAWQSLGDVVAMTGDGVNDALAIKEADIGVAMGIKGAEITKEASDMVILDDNFASIVTAVKEGRGIYDNILKFVSYLLSTNLAEILIIFVGLLLSFQDNSGNLVVPLTAVQLLWINLVSDGFPAISLGIDPLDPQALARPPRKLSDPLFSLREVANLLILNVLIAIGALAACYYGLQEGKEYAQSMTFTTVVILELVMVQIIRLRYHMKIFSNPYVSMAVAFSFLLQLCVLYVPLFQKIFKTVPLSLTDWSLIAALGAALWLLNRVLTMMTRNSMDSQ